jgi:Flp pilus assembly protein TadD
MNLLERKGRFPMATKRYQQTLMSLGLAGVIAVAAFASSEAVVAKPKPDQTAARAQDELKKGHVDKAISLAEAAVQAAPREPAYRALLGQAYLRAGRFQSAVTALNDAMTLGENSARTALALSLANIAAGNNREALAILNDWRDAIPANDLGLALALAGDTGRGVQLLHDRLRAGDTSPKLRQNLAYAFALDGRWREARMMVSQDIPANQIDARLSSWAAQSAPGAYQARVATLLGAPVRGDPGMPVQLALNASSDVQQAAAEAAALPEVAAPAPVAVAVAAPSELPPVDGLPVAAPVEVAAYNPPAAPTVETSAEAVLPAGAPTERFEQAFASNEPTFVSNPVVQAIPARAEPARPAARPVRATPRYAAAPTAAPRRAPRHAAAAPAPRLAGVRVAATPVAARPVAGVGTHLVQLGSFSSQQGARRAWGIYAAANPSLKNFKMTITQATVRGKLYWRVAAAGFDGTGARGWCASLKQSGGACFAYAVPRSGAPALAAAPTPRRAVVARR